MDIYKQASRQGLRFSSGKGGLLTVDDLWQLDLAVLDRMAVSLNASLQSENTATFLRGTSTQARKQTRARRDDTLRLDILKDILDTRQSEAEARARRTETREQRKFLQDLLVKQRQKAMEGLSAEDLEARIAALEVTETDDED